MDKIVLVLPELERVVFRYVKANKCNTNPVSDENIPYAYEIRCCSGFPKGILRVEVCHVEQLHLIRRLSVIFNNDAH